MSKYQFGRFARFSRAILAVSAAILLCDDAAADPLAADSWSRAYFGASGGGGAMNTDVDVLGISSFSGIGAEGWLAEGRVGVDFQLRRFVLGFLADAQREEIVTKASILGIADAEAGTQWGIDALGRAGLLLNDDTLLYALGGLSGSQFEGEVNVPVIPINFQNDWFWSGWTVGAGIESDITNRLSALLEYRFTQFESADALGIAEFEPHRHTARLGVNWRFQIMGD